MTEMTRKKAEEMISSYCFFNRCLCKRTHSEKLNNMAKGYLLASDHYRAREKVLVEALEKIRCQDSLEDPEQKGCHTFLNETDMVKIADKVFTTLKGMEE